ncbi:MAG: hypothetical protein J6B24_12365, partial [Clostridia bacterium]|nr:hypothetical protein [Clostridia bacterium]
LNFASRISSSKIPLFPISFAPLLGFPYYNINLLHGCEHWEFLEMPCSLSVRSPRPLRHKTGEGRSPSLKEVAGSAEGGRRNTKSGKYSKLLVAAYKCR